MDPLKRFVLTLRLRKTQYTVVEQCALFARLVGGQVVQGWACSKNEACLHHWVEHGDQVYDVGKAYTLLFEPELASVETRLLRTIEDDVQPIGEKEPIIQRNRELYDLLVNDPKKFWKDIKPFKFPK